MTSTEFPINLVIPLASAKELEIVERLLADARTNDSNTFLAKAHYSNHDESQQARLMINGEEVKRGTLEQMRAAFQLQTEMSQKANILVQEWQKPLCDKPGAFVTVQSRLVRTC